MRGGVAVTSILLNISVTGICCGNCASSAGEIRHRGIDDVKHPIGAGEFAYRAAHAFGFDDIGGRCADPRCRSRFNGRPSRCTRWRSTSRVVPGMIGDDGDFIAHQPIQQAGFTRIGLAGDDDVQALAQQRALTRRRRDGVETGEQRAEATAQRCIESKSSSSSGKSMAASTRLRSSVICACSA